MVRIVSASGLGFGDYGGSVFDREVDGLAFEKLESPSPQPLSPVGLALKPAPIVGGKACKPRKLLSQPAPKIQ